MGETLQPWHILVLGFVFSVFLLIPAIFYLLTVQKALTRCSPASRTMEPGMVWLCLIPLFHLIWNFFVVMALGNSLGNEYARRGIPRPEMLPGQNIGLAMSICLCCTIVPIVNLLAGPAALVLWIIYWIKIANYSAMLGDFQPMAAPPMGS